MLSAGQAGASSPPPEGAWALPLGPGRVPESLVVHPQRLLGCAPLNPAAGTWACSRCLRNERVNGRWVGGWWMDGRTDGRRVDGSRWGSEPDAPLTHSERARGLLRSAVALTPALSPFPGKLPRGPWLAQIPARRAGPAVSGPRNQGSPPQVLRKPRLAWPSPHFPPLPASRLGPARANPKRPAQ